MLLLNVLRGLFEARQNGFYLVLLFLVLVPVVEIGIFQQLIELVIGGFVGDQLTEGAVTKVIFFMVFLVLVAYLTYRYKIQRIKYINYLTALKKRKVKMSPFMVNWYRASLLEASLIFVGIMQVVLICSVSTYFSLLFGGICSFFSVVSMLLIYSKFKKEKVNQAEFVKREYRQKRSQSGNKVLSRITSSEISGLFSSVMMYLVLVFDFVLFNYGLIDQAMLVIFLFVAKYIGNSFGMISSSMMRLARSLTYTSKIYQ